MPEGPEVWVLSKAVNIHFNETKSLSYGKHLFIFDKKENWCFDLNKIPESGYLKVMCENVCG